MKKRNVFVYGAEHGRERRASAGGPVVAGGDGRGPCSIWGSHPPMGGLG